MKNTIRLFHWSAGIALGVILLSAACATAEDDKVIVAFEEADTAPQVTREAAITLAQQYTGLAEKMAVRARYGFATDTSIPFFNVVKRPAWEVLFDRVEVSITKRDGTKEKNPNISAITVLLDAETGALLKVSSPKPAASGLTKERGEQVERTFGNGLVLKSTPTKPRMPFMQALEYAELGESGLVAEANQVIAYFGLLTDVLRLENRIKDQPYWMIFLGGVEVVGLGGPPGGPGVTPATQAMVVLDADTDVWYLTHLSGGHVIGN